VLEEVLSSLEEVALSDGEGVAISVDEESVTEGAAALSTEED
jgi:hypothetical protein